MDDAVVATGTDAAISKLSAARIGYTADDFIPHFVDAKRRRLRRAPLINRGYFARSCAVDTLVLNNMLLVLLALLARSLSSTASSQPPLAATTLVLMDDAETTRASHSRFFAALRARGHALTFALADAEDVRLSAHGVIYLS